MPETPISRAAATNGAARVPRVEDDVAGVAIGDHLARPRQRVAATGEGVEEGDVHRDRRGAAGVHFHHRDALVERAQHRRHPAHDDLVVVDDTDPDDGDPVPVRVGALLFDDRHASPPDCQRRRQTTVAIRSSPRTSTASHKRRTIPSPRPLRARAGASRQSSTGGIRSTGPSLETCNTTSAGGRSATSTSTAPAGRPWTMALVINSLATRRTSSATRRGDGVRHQVLVHRPPGWGDLLGPGRDVQHQRLRRIAETRRGFGAARRHGGRVPNRRRCSNDHQRGYDRSMECGGRAAR